MILLRLLELSCRICGFVICKSDNFHKDRDKDLVWFKIDDREHCRLQIVQFFIHVMCQRKRARTSSSAAYLRASIGINIKKQRTSSHFLTRCDSAMDS